MAQWEFKPLIPGYTNRNPIHGEFFAADAISDPGMALVREGIQNSLDARRDGEPVLVRILFSDGENAAKPQDVDPYFAGAWDHLHAADNGLHPDDLPQPDATCPFFLFEDFGTTGLEGDPAQAFHSRNGAKNHFYYFFRAEGQSDKDATDRGRWGVGKQVFPRSSRISTVFGLTVRNSDGQRLLMGKSVLLQHYVDESCPYQDGYFGKSSTPENPLVMPCCEICVADGKLKRPDPG